MMRIALMVGALLALTNCGPVSDSVEYELEMGTPYSEHFDGTVPSHDMIHHDGTEHSANALCQCCSDCSWAGNSPSWCFSYCHPMPPSPI